jgi:hypothetical protein
VTATVLGSCLEDLPAQITTLPLFHIEILSGESFFGNFRLLVVPFKIMTGRGNNRRGRGRRNGNGNALRAVNNKLRSLHVNSAPHWFEPRSGRRFRGADVPQYVSDTIYSRRVRFLFITAATPILQTITYAQIFTALGWTQGATSFDNVFVRRITVWGPDTASIVVSPFIANSPASSTRDRDFSDIGVPGSRRSCVVVEISPKDSGLINTGAPVVVTILSNVGASQHIVDMNVEFSGSNTTALGHVLS